MDLDFLFCPICINDLPSSVLLLAERLKERLDFMLKEGLAENSYLNSITAHLSYWNSPDVAHYILLQLYKYKPT